MDSLTVTLVFYGASTLALLLGLVIGSHLRQPIRFRHNHRPRGTPENTPVASKGPLTETELRRAETDIREKLAMTGLSADRIEVVAREMIGKGKNMMGQIGGERP